MLASRTIEHLASRGIDVAAGWARYGNYFSRPLLAATLLSGHNIREYHDGVRFGYHEFWRSPALARLFLELQSVDILFSNHWRLARPSVQHELLVCDRGPYDTMVDVMLDTRIDLTAGGQWRRFVRLLPARHCVVHVSRPIPDIVRSRPVLAHDRDLEAKDALYRKLRDFFDWETVVNIGSPEEVFERVVALVDRRLAG